MAVALEADFELGHALAEGREGGGVVAMADLDIPGHPVRLGAIFVAGGVPVVTTARRGRAADGGEGIPGPDQAAVGRGDHPIEGLCRQVKVGPGEGVILGQPIELQGAVLHLHHPR